MFFLASNLFSIRRLYLHLYNHMINHKYVLLNSQIRFSSILDILANILKRWQTSPSAQPCTSDFYFSLTIPSRQNRNKLNALISEALQHSFEKHATPISLWIDCLKFLFRFYFVFLMVILEFMKTNYRLNGRIWLKWIVD